MLTRDDIKDNITVAQCTNCMILPNGMSYSMDSIMTRLNNNVMIFGASGSGKTRGVVIPNLLVAFGSYIVSDPKGNLCDRFGSFLEANGYRVVKLDLIHPERSAHYNPLSYLKTSSDIMKLAHQIVYGSDISARRSNDPFWDRASVMLLSALIGYYVDGGKEWEPSFHGIIRLLSSIDVEAMEEGEECELDRIFGALNEEYFLQNGEDCWSYKQYRKFKNLACRTNSCIIMTLQGILGELDTKELREMMRNDEVDIFSVGQRKTVVFVEISDTDRSKDVLANVFYSQAMNILCSYADDQCEGSILPVPVRFILDDFATNCRIDGFENMISNIRSRGISAMLILQSISQLEAGYGVSAHTIMDNCDTQVYMGGNDIDTAEMVAEKCNKPTHQILNMPLGTNWIFRRGEQPMFSRTVDLSEYDIPDPHETKCFIPIKQIPERPDIREGRKHD